MCWFEIEADRMLIALIAEIIHAYFICIRQ